MSVLKLNTVVDLSYQVSGSGPALLFFNGATLPLEFWDPVVKRLDERYRCVRLDQRNAGNTRYDGTFTLNDVAADAAALLDQLDISSAVAIGHAWGGRVAQVFARDYPHRTRGVVVCGTGGALPAAVPPGDLKALRDAARAGDHAGWEVLLEAIYCAEGFSRRAPAAFAEISDLLWGRRPPGKARWDDQVSPSSSYWGRFEQPSLLIYGLEDKNGTPANAEHLRAALTHTRLELIENTGHFVVREASATVSNLIDGFMQSGLDQSAAGP